MFGIADAYAFAIDKRLCSFVKAVLSKTMELNWK